MKRLLRSDAIAQRRMTLDEEGGRANENYGYSYLVSKYHSADGHTR